jgi:hypothetical protein
MGFLVGLVLLAQAEAGEGKEACRKAIEAFHAETKAGTESARISGIDALSKHHCVPAIAVIAPLLQAPEETVRVAAARALGAMEHLEAVEALAGSLTANESSKAALEAIVKALQTLDWEAGAEPLNSLLVKYHEKGMMDELKPVIQTLGSLGSASSVDPLLKLLEHAENEAQGGRVGKVRSTPNPKLKALEGPIRSALQAITGGTEPNYRTWREWWQANRERLVESATIVYRCRLTGKRWEQKSGEAQSCPNHDKPEKDGQLVKTRLKPRA